MPGWPAPYRLDSMPHLRVILLPDRRLAVVRDQYASLTQHGAIVTDLGGFDMGELALRNTPSTPVRLANVDHKFLADYRRAAQGPRADDLADPEATLLYMLARAGVLTGEEVRRVMGLGPGVDAAELRPEPVASLVAIGLPATTAQQVSAASPALQRHRILQTQALAVRIRDEHLAAAGPTGGWLGYLPAAAGPASPSPPPPPLPPPSLPFRKDRPRRRIDLTGFAAG